MACQERPGPVHLELPEDIAGEETVQIATVAPHPIDIPVAHPAAGCAGWRKLLNHNKRPDVANAWPGVPLRETEILKRFTLPYKEPNPEPQTSRLPRCP